MQGGEDVLGDVDPNLAFDLEDMGLEGISEAGQAVGGAAHQKSVPAHHARPEVRRG